MSNESRRKHLIELLPLVGNNQMYELLLLPTALCSHKWTRYEGFTDSYDHCELCGEIADE
jgi:hypothetical protein